MKKVLCILCVLVMILSCASCGASPESMLVGRWKQVEGHEFSYLEFFDDGSYVSNNTNYEGGFSVSNDRLRLQGCLVDSLTYTFSVSKDTLTFYTDEGEAYCVYEKVE